MIFFLRNVSALILIHAWQIKIKQILGRKGQRMNLYKPGGTIQEGYIITVGQTPKNRKLFIEK